VAEVNPFELFQKESPELAARFAELVNAQRARPGLDDKTRHLLVIAISTANRNPRGVMTHATMARKFGATRDEVLSAVLMNLHLSGLGSVLDALPAAVQGYGEK
jgi:AhpD family alkylhydroperoxidase